jgi:glucokinase
MAKISKTNKNTSKNRPRGLTIGLDLGGTKIAAALVDSRGQTLEVMVSPTVPHDLSTQDPRATAKPSPASVRKHIQYVVEAMAKATIKVLGTHSPKELLGIGLASAGPMNLEEGTLNYPSNFKGWKNVPLVELFQKALAKEGLKRPQNFIHFQNDAIAAALGEGWVGKAAGCDTYAMITVGTGIGTGVILNGKPAQSRGMGSEWGHLLVSARGLGADPLSYASREVEGISSGTGLVLRAKEQGLDFSSAHQIAEAARAGDSRARALFEGAAEGLAALFFSLSLGFHPEKFVVGGGMLAVQDLFLKRAIDIYRQSLKDKNPLFVAPVEISRLENKAGVIGAARLPHLARL